MEGSVSSVYKNREFNIYLCTRFLMTFAIQMQNIITGWYLYELTKNEFILGLIGLAEAIPAIGSALFAGNIVDRRDKKSILVWAFVTYTLCGLGYVFFGSQYAYEHLGMQAVVYGFFAISMLFGLSRAFAAPASFSILPYLFKKKDMARATSVSSTAWQIGAIGGPAIGGIIYANTDTVTASFIMTCIMALSLVCAMMLKPKPPYTHEQSDTQNVWQRIREGLNYVFKNKVILSAMSLDLFAVLFGGAVVLLPVFAADVLHVGKMELGWLKAAPSVGAAILLIFLSVKPPEHKTGLKLLLAVAGFGLCIIGFSQSTSLWLSIFLLFCSGGFDAMSVVIRGTILQIYTPDHMRGRVSAVNSMFIGSSNEIGAFESGTAARVMGLQPSVLFGGVMTLLIVGIVAKVSPQLRKLELKDDPDI